MVLDCRYYLWTLLRRLVLPRIYTARARIAVWMARSLACRSWSLRDRTAVPARLGPMGARAGQDGSLARLGWCAAAAGRSLPARLLPRARS